MKRQVLLGLGVGGWEQRKPGSSEETSSPIGLVLDPLPVPAESGVMHPLGPVPPARVSPRFPPWVSAAPSQTQGLRSPLPAPSSSGPGDPANFLWQGRAWKAGPSETQVGWGEGKGGRWATWAEGSGLLEPRQHTCVSNFLSSLLSACLLPVLPLPLGLGL